MIKEIAIMHIDNEISLARKALAIGNVGKARVCARRAAGIAVTYWLDLHPELHWGESAIGMLNKLTEDNSMDGEIRNAAARLTASVKNQNPLQFTQDPLYDSNIIINYFLNNK